MSHEIVRFLRWFLVLSSFHRFPFLLCNLKLSVEALNGHEGILYRSLHGDPELALLLAKLNGDPFQDLWELPQDLQRNMPVGSRNLCLEIIPLVHTKRSRKQVMERDASPTSQLDTDIPVSP